MAHHVEIDLGINQNKLDEEWLGQADKTMQIGSYYADAKRDVAVAEGELAVTKAEISEAIMSDPGGFGLASTAAANIALAIPKQKEFQVAQKKLIAARHRADLLCEAIMACRDRKKALENLVELYLAGYFARCTPTSDAAAEHVDRPTRANGPRRRTMRDGADT